MNLVRLLVPMLLAMGGAVAVSELMRRRGLVPPRFAPALDGARPALAGPDRYWEPAFRQFLATGVLVVVLYLGVMAPLGALGLELVPELEKLRVGQLFILHWLFAAALLAWYFLGFVPSRGGSTTSLTAQFGMRAQSIGRELLLGIAAGAGIWLVVIVLLLLLSGLVALFGGLESLPQEPPPMVLWIAGLPIWVKVAVSLSAGFFEEVFFRGFLQPRVGIGLSTAFFSLAHLSYDQPFLLVGVTMLSLLFSWLVWWRQSIWAAVAAHAVFDLIQLVIVIPLVTGVLDVEGGLATLL